MSKKNKSSNLNEINLKTIYMGSFPSARSSFMHYYAVGGNQVAFGEFKGTVSKITQNRKFLFERIDVSFDEMDGTIISGKENHVWMSDTNEFFKMNIKKGDCVKFNALVYAYKRKNKSIDFALKEPQFIEIINSYELVSDEFLKRQEAERIVCSLCTFSEHCYGTLCIANMEWKKDITNTILSNM